MNSGEILYTINLEIAAARIQLLYSVSVLVHMGVTLFFQATLTQILDDCRNCVVRWGIGSPLFNLEFITPKDIQLVVLTACIGKQADTMHKCPQCAHQ